MDLPGTEARSLAPPHRSSCAHLRINLPHKFQAELRAWEPSAPPPVPPQSVSVTHRDPGISRRWNTSHSSLPPTHPSTPSVRLLITHLLSPRWLLSPTTHPPPRKKKKKESQPGELVLDFGLLLRGGGGGGGSSVGQGALHLSPRRGCGIKEREDGEGARCCCDGCLCLRHCERLPLARAAFHLPFSLPLSAPPLFTPSLFSVTVYLLLLQLFGFTIQHAAGRAQKAPSLNGQAG